MIATQARVCQTCGHVGYEECLVFCSRCEVSAEHLYCIARSLELGGVVKWTCHECSDLADVQKNVFQIATEYFSRPFDVKKALSSIEEDEMLNVEQPSLANRPSSDAKMKDCETYQVIEKSDPKVTCSKEVDEKCTVAVDTDSTGNILKMENVNKSVKTRSETSQENENKSVKTGSETSQENENKSVKTGSDISQAEDCQRNAYEAKEIVIKYNQTCGSQDIRKIDGYVYSEPSTVVWWGWFAIGQSQHFKMGAYISNKACERVYNEAKKIPSVLSLEKYSRGKVWPKKFLDGQQTDDDIALFFFPAIAESESICTKLLDEVSKEELMLRAILDSSELLIFSSFLLPKSYWRYNNRCYLWGVFRRRQCT